MEDENCKNNLNVGEVVALLSVLVFISIFIFYGLAINRELSSDYILIFLFIALVIIIGVTFLSNLHPSVKLGIVMVSIIAYFIIEFMRHPRQFAL